MNRRGIAIAVLIGLIICRTGVAGDRTLLLFAKEPSFLPAIEATLDSLRDFETGDSIFSKITNLNKWSVNRHEEAELDNLVRYYESGPLLRRKSSSKRRADDSLTVLIKAATAYIRIDVLQKLPLVEFQLLITDSVPMGNTAEFPELITAQTRLVGFVIDISRGDCQNQISKAIRALFPRSNMPPRVILRVPEAREVGGAYYMAIDRPLTLDASESYDPDDSRTELRYSWRQINTTDTSRPVPSASLVQLAPGAKHQDLSFAEPGQYEFGLLCTDGISLSSEQVIRLVVTEPPLLKAGPVEPIKTYSFSGPATLRIPFRSSAGSSGGKPMIRVVSAEMRAKRSILSYLRGSKATVFQPYSLNYLKIDRSNQDTATDSSGEHFELTVQATGGAVGEYYRVWMVSDDGYVTSDTLCLEFERKDRAEAVAFHLMRSESWGKKATPNGSQEHWSADAVILGVGLKRNIRQDFSIEFGNYFILNSERSEGTNRGFRHTNSYIRVNTPHYYSFSVQFAGEYTGVGMGLDLGRTISRYSATTEIVYFRRWRSAAVSINLDSEMGMWTVLGGVVTLGIGLFL